MAAIPPTAASGSILSRKRPRSSSDALLAAAEAARQTTYDRLNWSAPSDEAAVAVVDQIEGAAGAVVLSFTRDRQHRPGVFTRATFTDRQRAAEEYLARRASSNPPSLRDIVAEYAVRGVEMSVASLHGHVFGTKKKDKVTGATIVVRPTGPPGRRPYLDHRLAVALWQYVRLSAQQRVPRSLLQIKRHAALLALAHGRPFRDKHNNTHDVKGQLVLPGHYWYRKWSGLFGGAKIVEPRSSTTLRPTRDELNAYYNDLYAIISTYNITPDRLANLDESGFNEVGGRVQVVVPRTDYRGKGATHSLDAVARGTKMRHLTLVATIFADGTFLPPTFIWAATATDQKTLWNRLKHDAPRLRQAHPGATLTYTPTGWSNTEIFSMVVQKLVALKRPTAERPVLLIMDGASCHLDGDTIDWAAAHHVLMFLLLPNATALLQPLDVSVFRSLKQATGALIETEMRDAARSVADIQSTVIDYITAGIRTSFTRENIISGFRATGIFPCNPLAVSDAELMPVAAPPAPADRAGISKQLAELRRAAETKMATLTDLCAEVGAADPADQEEQLQTILRRATGEAIDANCVPIPAELDGILHFVPLPELRGTERTAPSPVHRTLPAGVINRNPARRYWLLNPKAADTLAARHRTAKKKKSAAGGVGGVGSVSGLRSTLSRTARTDHAMRVAPNWSTAPTAPSSSSSGPAVATPADEEEPESPPSPASGRRGRRRARRGPAVPATDDEESERSEAAST